jgi:hypothetical protein
MVGTTTLLVARILLMQGNLGEETMTFFERSLCIFIRHEGPYAMNCGTGNITLGQYHCARAERQPTFELKCEQLLLAKPYFEAGIRIDSQIYGPSSPRNADEKSRLAYVVQTSATYLTERDLPELIPIK